MGGVDQKGRLRKRIQEGVSPDIDALVGRLAATERRVSRFFIGTSSAFVFAATASVLDFSLLVVLPMLILPAITISRYSPPR
ncbi:MAG: hypothetical protein V5A36_01400 [Natronomonas sp.]